MGAQAVRLSNVDIDNALEKGDFEVLFQPIFDLGNGSLARMETFVRWRHPSLGVLPPGAFISFFESQGRMSELSRYVLSAALQNYVKWRGNQGPGFSINLALTDLADDAIASHLQVLLREHQFPADAVTLECPMPPVTADPDQAREQFESLRKTGARLAIEVRGRANEFLRNVDPFPFDEIKTGGAAILRFARTVRGPGLSAISELLDIASNASASITAVGVEDQASLSALRGLGFSAAQGNHLAKVGSLTDFRPGTINSVRKLLELEELSSTQLGALLKTGNVDAASEPSTLDGFEAPADKDTEIDLTKDDQLDEPAGGDDAIQEKVEIVQADSVDANVSTAERAKRKAALLAKKKGKDAVRAEIAARRKRLGLSTKNPTVETQVSAAKNLQNRLSNAYSTDDAPDTNSDEPNDSSDNAAILDSEQIDSAQIDSAQTIEPVSELSETEAVEIEAPLSEPENEGLDDDKANLDLDAADTAVEENTEDQKEEVSPIADNIVDADNVTAASPTPTSDTPEEPQTPSLEEPQQIAVYMGYAGAGAYFIDTWPINIERQALNAPVKPAEPEQDVSNLVLFSLDDPPAQPESHKELPRARTATIAPRAPSTTPPDPQATPIDDVITVQGTLDDDAYEDVVELPVTTFEKPTAPSIPDVDVTDGQEPGTTFGDLINDDEDGLIAASQALEASPSPVISDRGSRKNFLTRKYQIWPTHFWPRSWKRAWEKRAANKDFVRRAREAADRLNEGGDDPRDNLF